MYIYTSQTLTFKTFFIVYTSHFQNNGIKIGAVNCSSKRKRFKPLKNLIQKQQTYMLTGDA